MMTLTLNLRGMTWSELRKFVELAKEQSDEDLVDLDVDENLDVTGLVIDV